MASFRRSGRGWRAEIQKLGIRESATFPTKREAQEWAAKRESEIVSQRSGKVIRWTLYDVLGRYIEEIASQQHGARAETLLLKKMQRLPMAKRVMQDITPSELAKWRDMRLKEVQPSSVLREMTVLKSVWKQAK